MNSARIDRRCRCPSGDRKVKNLRDKRALITGAGSGIGRAIALELAHQGSHLWLLDINELTLESVTAEVRSCGVDVMARRCDLRRGDEIRSAFDEVLKTWSGIDILVNNAGIICYGATENVSDQQWTELLAVNLTAPITLTRLFLPSLLKRPEAHKRLQHLRTGSQEALGCLSDCEIRIGRIQPITALGIRTTRAGDYCVMSGLGADRSDRRG
jgi:NAD(P)-dependent dehydrogenase (short-subunit alcohol dehydrogenase family)